MKTIELDLKKKNMKIVETLELNLKKQIIIVEPDKPENIKTWISIYSEYGDFLCKGSELTEEIASELAFDGFNISENKKVYVDHYDECNCFESAIKSVISYVRIEGFHWLENPIEKPINRDEFYKSEKVDSFEILLKEWQEAEEKTFKNPLIFVKND